MIKMMLNLKCPRCLEPPTLIELISTLRQQTERVQNHLLNIEIRRYKNHNILQLTSLQSKKVDNDLGFLNEENQWAAIYKYNRHLFDKEAEILKHRFK